MQLTRSQFAPSAAGIHVAVEPGFDFTGPEYRALYEACDATAFQHPIWLDRFYRMLAPARDAQKIVVTGREPEDGKLRFILPMISRRLSGIQLVDTADLGVSDYAAPIVDRDWRADEPQVAAMVREALGSHDVLRIRPIRAEAVSAWRRFFDRAPEELDFSAHAATLDAPYSAWRPRACDKSFVKYLDRKKKRFIKSGAVELRFLSDPIEIRGSIAAIRDLRAGRFAGDPIQQPAVERFYAEVAAAGADSGFARTCVLTLEGEPVAHAFGLGWRGRFHYLLIGCDYERHGRHSPGLILYDMLIEAWMREGGQVFDFTIGDEPFKKDFGTQPTAIFGMTAQPTLRGRLAMLAVQSRERLRRATAGAE